MPDSDRFVSEANVEQAETDARKVVMGALQSAVDAHGPVTRANVTSATRRVVAQLRAMRGDLRLTGPDGRLNCGHCAERLAINVGLMAENAELRRKLADRSEITRLRSEAEALREQNRKHDVWHGELQAEAQRAREALTPVDPDSATILIGEGLHTGLRKGCEDGDDAWRAIHDLPEGQWSAALHFLVDGLDFMGYVLCERKTEESE